MQRCASKEKTIRDKIGYRGHLSTLLKLESRQVDRVALAPYTLATKSTVSVTKLNMSATKSTATSCRIHVVADLLPKPATKLNVYGNSRLCCQFVAGFGNSRLLTKSTVLNSTLNSTLSPVCTGYYSIANYKLSDRWWNVQGGSEASWYRNVQRRETSRWRTVQVTNWQSSETSLNRCTSFLSVLYKE